MLHKRFLTILSFLITLIATSYAANRFTLVIDAGHGGHDAGAIGSFSKEKDINLKAALAFGRYVERNCPDVKVIYTRKTDVFVTLHDRADIANKNHADVFVSIHTNSLPAGKVARGVETYTMGMRRSDEKLSAAKRENSVITIEKDYQQHYAGYDPNSPESTIMFEFINDKNMAKSVELAKLVQKSICSSASRPDKGVKQDVFLVLRETSMPACLIELGFISTADEESALNNATTIDKMAYGIYEAFVRYKNKNGGTNTPIRAYQPSAEPAPKATASTTTPKDSDKQSRNEQKQEKAKETKKDTASDNARADKESSNDKVVAQQMPDVQPEKARQDAASDADAPILYKVQFTTSPRKLSEGAAQFKGLTDVDCYNDGSTYKYTIGSSTSSAEMSRLRRTILDKFPDAFVVGFKNGVRVK